ncbi:MAG: iron-containing redox enzyme family protein [Bdellovibrionales bacterium]|nr:iron-containing redox enzyme family protein [Bdellovibrionales bacterium]
MSLIDNLKAELRNQLDEAKQKLDQYPWEDTAFYKLFCAQTYYYVCHTVPLMKNAAKYVKDEVITEALEHHIKEEKGHENMAKRDITKMGDSVENLPELNKTKSIYNTIYTATPNEPLAVVGYGLALENLACEYASVISDRVKKGTGRNDITFFLDCHAEIDKTHTQESDVMLNQLSEESLTELKKYMYIGFENYLNMVEEVYQQSNLQKAIA